MRQLEKRETDSGSELLSICETLAKIQNIFDGSGNFKEDCRVYATRMDWVLECFTRR